jgi:hypothetical protein
MPGPYGPPPIWKKGDPLTAQKLNEANARNIRECRVDNTMQVTRTGGDISLRVNIPGVPWEILRVKLTTVPDDSTPYVAGGTPWDGTDLAEYELYFKLLFPHSANDDLYIMQPFGGTDQTDPDGQPVVWIEVDRSPNVVVKITGNVSGAGGKYDGTIYSGVMNDAGTGNLAMPDGLTSGMNCLVLNLDEQTQPTHWLTTGTSSSYAQGVYWGMSTESPSRPIIVIDRGDYRVDSAQALSCPAPNVDSAATDSWDREVETAGNQYGDGPVSFSCVTRLGYNPSDATPTLGYFYRTTTFAADGRLDTVSEETFVSVDVPDSCTS